MQQLIESLNTLWTEYERRLIIIEANEYTIKNARQYINRLNEFMLQKCYTVYSPEVGEAFLAFVKSDQRKSKWLFRYRLMIKYVNSCLSGEFWGEDFRLISYTIKTSCLNSLYEKLCQSFDARGARKSVNDVRDYALCCLKKLDLYMLENHIEQYSPEVGHDFIECMKSVSQKGATSFAATYTRTIRLIDGLFSGDALYIRTQPCYEIKHEQLRVALGELFRRYDENHFTERTKKAAKRVIKHLDIFMSDQKIDIYTEQVGKDFSVWFNQHLNTTKKHNGYEMYILSHFNDVIKGETYHCCHRKPGLSIPKEFRPSFDLYIQDCQNDLNRDSTMFRKAYCCAYFFRALLSVGCANIKQITIEAVIKSCAMVNDHSWGSIRGYLRSCFNHGLITKDVSFFVPHMRSKEVFPTYYSKEERQRLEAAPDRRTSIGKRDYAIILILNHLGLRSSDVTNMTFSNLLFDGKNISFNQYKTGNPQSLPLLEEIENAVQDYIDNGRPSSDSPYVFLRAVAPLGPITPKAIHRIVTKNFIKAGVDFLGRKHGGHALRSSLLSSMVNNGLTYEDAQYVSGHKDERSIKHYASLDIAHLRLCASSIPEPKGNYKKLLGGI